MALTKIRIFFFSLACVCASAAAQPSAADALSCGPAERAAPAAFAERGIAELRGFLFAKKQLDQLAQYLESEEGAAKWAGATPASRLKLMESAVRSAAVSSSAVTHLPFLPATRYLFEGYFTVECSRSAELLAQMREPGFARYLDLRARVAAAALAWYGSGLFAKLTQDAALPDFQPFAIAPADAPPKAAPLAAEPPKAAPRKPEPRRVVARKPAPSRAPAPKRKSAAAKPTPAEAQNILANRVAAVDLLFREYGMFNVGLTAVERDRVIKGAIAAAPAALLNDAVEILSEARVKALLLDPAYLAFNYAVMATAYKAEPLLVKDYPHLEALGRNVSQVWAADLLRPVPKPPPGEQKPGAAPPAPAAAPKP